MAAISKVFLIIVLVSGICAKRKNTYEDEKQDEGQKRCNNLHGQSYYYVVNVEYCCPCSPCSDQSSPNLQCWKNNAEEGCGLPENQGYAHCLSSYRDDSEIPPLSTSASLKKSTTTPNRTSTAVAPTTSPRRSVIHVAPNDYATLLKVVIPLLVLACLTTMCICIFCIIRNDRSLAQRLSLRNFCLRNIESKVGRDPPRPKYESQSSDGSGTQLIQEPPNVSNEMPPPGSPSSECGSYTDGPHEMMHVPQVRPQFTSVRTESNPERSPSYHSMRNSRPSNDSLGNVPAIPAPRPYIEHVQDYPNHEPPRGTVVIANADRYGTINTGPIHVHIHSSGGPDQAPHVNMMNQQIVGRQPVAGMNPTGNSYGRTSRREEYVSTHRLERQNSDHPSAPVENELSDNWNESVARRDQVTELAACQSQSDSFSQCGPVQHSTCPQRLYSSPQSDVEK